MKFYFHIFFFSLILAALNVNSQDIIFCNNDTIKCRIIKDHITYLEYKVENDTTIHKIPIDQYNYYLQKSILVNKKDTKDTIYYNHVHSDTIIRKKYVPDNKTQDLFASIGLGMGLNYGGIFGVNASLSPIRYASIFFGLGYNLYEMGYNVGTMISIAPDSFIGLDLGGMYGYNSVIIIKGAPNYNKTYYGPSLYIGMVLRYVKNKNNMTIGMILPSRSESFYKDLAKIKSTPGIVLYNKPSDVLISIGFHYIIN